MLIANILMAILIAADFFIMTISVARALSGNPGKLICIGDDLTQIMLWSMFAAWAWAMFKLYRDVKHSEKLLPDKKIFIVPGSLLIVFLIFELIA